MSKIEKRTNAEVQVSAHMRNIRALIEEAIASGNEKVVIESSITIARGGVRDKKVLFVRYL